MSIDSLDFVLGSKKDICERIHAVPNGYILDEDMASVGLACMGELQFLNKIKSIQNNPIQED